MQTLDQDETLAVVADQDRGLLAVLDHALGDLLDGLGVERALPFGRHIDIGGLECPIFEHRHGSSSSQSGIVTPSRRPTYPLPSASRPATMAAV